MKKLDLCLRRKMLTMCTSNFVVRRHLVFAAWTVRVRAILRSGSEAALLYIVRWYHNTDRGRA